MAEIGNGTAIFGSAEACRHKYRQDSNFYYLTGFKEPESICVIAPDHPDHKFILFVRPKDRTQEIWTGKRTGLEGAKEIYGADAAYSLADLDKELPKYVERVDKIHYTMGSDDDLDKKVLGLLNRFSGGRYSSGTGPVAIVDPAEIVRNMRAVKDAHEIEIIRKAAEISSDAYIAAMKHVKPGMYEY